MGNKKSKRNDFLARNAIYMLSIGVHGPGEHREKMRFALTIPDSMKMMRKSK